MVQKRFLGYNDHPINICVWDDVPEARGIVQIVHGMAEHIARYDDFARFLNSKGYIVLGDDHRGHGKSCDGKLGTVPDGDCFADTVQDVIKLSYHAVSTYKLPLVILGHSYGSFITQAYLQRASEMVNGAILCGSARQPSSLVNMGALVASLQKKFYGKDKEGALLEKLTFGSYNKKFKKEGSPHAWLSRDKENVKAYESDPMCGQTMSLGFYDSFFRNLKKLYTQEGLSNIRKSLPILIISGDRDPVGGFSNYVNALYDTYIDAGVLKLSLKLYEGARHEILNEDIKEEVYSDMLSFIDRVID